MIRWLYLIVPLALLLAAEPKAEPKKDIDLLQGEWVMAALEVEGKAVPEEKLGGTVLTIKGDKYTTAVKDNKHEVTIKLDPTQKPKSIDMEFPDGTNAPKVGQGIYKIDGDTFVLVRAQATDNPRPTEFGTWPNTGCFMVTWKRKTP